MKNYYSILGLNIFKTDNLKLKYKKLSKEYHPDIYNLDSSVFLNIKEAYDILKNNTTKDIYDSELFKYLDIPDFLTKDNAYIYYNNNHDIFLKIEDYISYNKIDFCDYCNGTGYKNKNICDECLGTCYMIKKINFKYTGKKIYNNYGNFNKKLILL